MYIDSEQAWYRGKVEQVGQGPDKTQVKVRSTDFGWCRFVKVDSLRQLPAALASLPVRCEKYKMAYIQPRGRDHGYSAADRLAGAEWLKQLINGRVVVAICHKHVRYGGGIMADCMVDDTNLNRAALQAGHVLSTMRMGGPPLPVHRPPKFYPNNHFVRGGPVGSFGVGAAADLDYATYNGKGASGAGDGHKSRAAGPNIKAGGSSVGGKSEEVKRLEKIVSEDKKTINKLKKNINLDAGIEAGTSQYPHQCCEAGPTLTQLWLRLRLPAPASGSG